MTAAGQKKGIFGQVRRNRGNVAGEPVRAPRLCRTASAQGQLVSAALIGVMSLAGETLRLRFPVQAPPTLPWLLITNS